MPCRPVASRCSGLSLQASGLTQRLPSPKRKCNTQDAAMLSVAAPVHSRRTAEGSQAAVHITQAGSLAVLGPRLAGTDVIH